jgi:hypothetical protein
MTIKAWRFVRDDGTVKRKSMRRSLRVKQGQTLVWRQPLELCKRGLHASMLPLDALAYAPGCMVCRVECSGETLHGEDKLVCSRRRVLWMADATMVLHEFAIWCAERALALADNPDERSLNVLRVKRLWLAGKATNGELSAAWEAAWAAAFAAARSAAVVATTAAARAAVCNASSCAVRASASAAACHAACRAAIVADGAAASAAACHVAMAADRAAASAAAIADQNAELERLLLSLGPLGAS